MNCKQWIKKWQFEYTWSKWVVVLPPGITTTFAKRKKTFSASQTHSVSSSKVEDIEEELPKRKESISGNRVIDV